MEKNLLNGKADVEVKRGWAARTDLWKRENEAKEKAIVAYAKKLEHTVRLKKDIRAKVFAKYGICQKTFYNYMNKHS